MSSHSSLSYSCEKAWTSLKMLCVPNADIKFRLKACYEYFSCIDAEDLPSDVRAEYKKIRKRMMQKPKLKYRSETLPQANIREMSWKKRQELAERMAFVCAHVFEAWGRSQVTALRRAA